MRTPGWDLVTAATLAAVLGSPGPAQTGGHPHIADLANGAILPTDPTKYSPWVNIPNGYWDRGESPLEP